MKVWEILKEKSIRHRKDILETLSGLLICTSAFLICLGFAGENAYACFIAAFGFMFLGSRLEIKSRKTDESAGSKKMKPTKEQPDPLDVFKKEAREYCRKISMFTKTSKNKKLCETVAFTHKKINRTLDELDEKEIRSGELSKYNSKYLSNYTNLLDSYNRLYNHKDMGPEYKETLSELEDAIIMYDTAFEILYKKAVESDQLARDYYPGEG